MQPEQPQPQDLTPPEILWEFLNEYEHLIPVDSFVVWPGPTTLVLIH